MTVTAGASRWWRAPPRARAGRYLAGGRAHQRGRRGGAAAVLGPRYHPAAGARRAAALGTDVVVAALVLLNLTDHFLPGDSLWVAPSAALALLGFARYRGLSWA